MTLCPSSSAEAGEPLAHEEHIPRMFYPTADTLPKRAEHSIRKVPMGELSLSAKAECLSPWTVYQKQGRAVLSSRLKAGARAARVSNE
jgi:hypothetical protein